MNRGIEIISGGLELLDRIVPLWEELNRHHMKKSIHFTEAINSRRFDARKNDLISKAKYLLAEVAVDLKGNLDIGYCVSTIDEGNVGEIDSLFIMEPYRKIGLGEKLTKSALTWLDDHGVLKKILCVGAGNDGVIGFYERFGFYPASIYLVQKS